MTNIDDLKGSLRILAYLLERDISITEFHNRKGHEYAVASQYAVNRSLHGLMSLGLVEQYESKTGITLVQTINNTLTELGKKVAPLAKQIIDLVPEIDD